MSTPVFLQITFVYTSGRYHSSGLSADQLGQVDLMIWFNGFSLGDFGAARMSVVQGGEVVQHELGGASLPHLWHALTEAGIPRRTPDIKGVIDTSAQWHNCRLALGHSEGSHDIELTMMEDGFVGDDAPAMRVFFARLFDLAEVNIPHVVAHMCDIDSE